MKFPQALIGRWHGKRYHSYNGVLKDLFGSRVYKIGLRLDFTCPNRDGTVAVGGCTYCNNASHTPRDYLARSSVADQLVQGAQAIRRRHRADCFIPYFQSYTNTYDSTEKLEKLYREALSFPDVVGLAIATRPDCLPNATLDLLAELSRQTYLWLELGLESMYDRTLQSVNRGHGLQDYIDTVIRAKQRGLRVCTHLILGFPGESREDMLATPSLLNQLHVDGIKLHNLHIVKNTVMEKHFLAGRVPLLSRDEYVDLVIDFVERLSPNTIIHRLSGETYRAITVAPDWSVNKLGIHNALYKAFEARDSWQGRLYRDPSDTQPSQTLTASGVGAAQ